MQLRTYTALLVVLIVLCMTCIAGFNIVIDPYRVFNSPDIAGINKFKVSFFLHQLQTKPYAVRRMKADAVVIGSSRAGAGIATDHPGWGNLKVYNYGLGGSSPYLNWRNYQHAKANGNLKKVLITLDLYMFNIYHNPENAQVYRDYEERLSVTPSNQTNYYYPVRWFKDTADMLFLLDTLLDSWSTVQLQPRTESGESLMATIFPSGFWISGIPPKMMQRGLFRAMENQYMTEMWFPPPSRKFALVDNEKKSKLEYLHKILKDCYQENIDVTLVFFPFHARLAESMHAVGIWPFFEKWKKDVVLLNEKEAAKAGQPAYPVWDFTGYNSITTESVPLPGDRHTRMKWHTDSTHISKAAGDLLQDRIWGTTETQGFMDFGRKVNSSNVDAHNAD
ncbi:MAG TPA: hypothetical protein VIV27_08090, partial [Halioglobus sp.]